MEDFKPIKGYENEYLIGSNGNVFSVRAGRTIRPNTDKDGYLYVVLSVNQKRKTMKVHRLVAMAFIPNAENKPAVDHINGNKTDNKVANLRWATNKENTNNPVTKKCLVSSARKRIPAMYEASRKRNFGRKPVAVIFENETKVFESLKKASEAIGIHCSKLSEMLNGKRKPPKGLTAIWASETEEFPIAVTKYRFLED